ncbi:MAG: SPFH domain-containing protein [Candidatus Thermoplasmatota archaeon]|nr:SPFH domain-containing protein [Candidatus Thermoplasmatota archaeon]MDP7265897.1 SPFH domain-containing protein [Candidatus Thermoplasmatota archaeon]
MGLFKKSGSRTVMWPENEKADQLVFKCPEAAHAGNLLVVRGNEFAVLFQYGAVKQVFSDPGQSTLPTDGNVFFVSKQKFEGKFGTKQPLTFHDARFDMVQLQAFGEYKCRVADPVKFLNEIGMDRRSLTPQDMAEIVRDEVVMALNQALGFMKKKGMAVTQIPQKLKAIGNVTVKAGKRSFEDMGMVLTEISELYINPPKKVKDAIQEVSTISAFTDEQISKRTKLAAGDAMRDAARSGGTVSIGRIGDESNVTIKDSVVQRSNIGGGGGGGASGETHIQDSVLTRTNVGGGGGGAAACPNCGGSIQAGWIACPACGEKLKQSCPGCGADIQSGWVACPACGNKL